MKYLGFDGVALLRGRRANNLADGIEAHWQERPGLRDHAVPDEEILQDAQTERRR